MSYMLPHLHNGWQVDQAILSEEDRALVIRFGHDWDPTCMKMDEVLYSVAEKVICILLYHCWCLDFTFVKTTERCYFYCTNITILPYRWKTLQSYIWWTSQWCRTSTRCTSCMILAPSCSSSGEFHVVIRLHLHFKPISSFDANIYHNWVREEGLAGWDFFVPLLRRVYALSFLCCVHPVSCHSNDEGLKLID